MHSDSESARLHKGKSGLQIQSPDQESRSGRLQKFNGDLQDGAFLHNLDHISGNAARILSQTYLWTRKSPLNFGSPPDRDPDSDQIWTPDPDWITLAGVCTLHSPSALVMIMMMMMMMIIIIIY